MDNLAQQKDELEALNSIYGSEWKAESDSGSSFSIEIDKNVKLFITLYPAYPSESPPSYTLQAPSLDRGIKKKISCMFEEVYLENVGAPVLYQWIEGLREIVRECKEEKKNTARTGNSSSSSSSDEHEVSYVPKAVVQKKNFNIITGNAIQDRKSTFQGHYCEVKSQSDVRCIINTLLENKKVANATHNISAYRIKTETGTMLQDCDDDGENHAGGRLLHLLQMLDVTNVVVIVSRWYGGIQLGPDRFRHINNAARQVLSQAGVIKSKETKTRSKKA